MSATPNLDAFYKEVMPHLTEEGQRKADAVLHEYALGHRMITEAEADEASDILVRIVRAHSIPGSPYNGS